MEATSRDSSEQSNEVVESECRDAKQIGVKHRIIGASFNTHEGKEKGDAAAEHGNHPRIGPAHRVAAIGLNPIGDAADEKAQTQGEGEVAGDVQPISHNAPAEPSQGTRDRAIRERAKMMNPRL